MSLVISVSCTPDMGFMPKLLRTVKWLCPPPRSTSLCTSGTHFCTLNTDGHPTVTQGEQELGGDEASHCTVCHNTQTTRSIELAHGSTHNSVPGWMRLNSI
jgi:hypothetical protein